MQTIEQKGVLRNDLLGKFAVAHGVIFQIERMKIETHGWNPTEVRIYVQGAGSYWVTTKSVECLADTRDECESYLNQKWVEDAVKVKSWQTHQLD